MHVEKIISTIHDEPYRQSDEIDAQGDETEDQGLDKDVESMLKSGGSLFYAQLTVGEATDRFFFVKNRGATGEHTVAQCHKKKGRYQK